MAEGRLKEARNGLAAAPGNDHDAGMDSASLADGDQDASLAPALLVRKKPDLTMLRTDPVCTPVVDKFPGEWVISYNLACYACQLGDLKAARQWLRKAIELAGKKEVKLMALDDPDLEPLRNEIGRGYRKRL